MRVPGWGRLSLLPPGLALLLGLAFIFWSPLRIPPHFESYDQLGWNLARGMGFTQGDVSNGPGVPEVFRTPGYPLFLAGFYSLFGHRPWVVYLAQALLYVLTSWIVYALAARSLGERKAWVAALLFSLYPFTAFYVGAILAETLSLFLLALFLYLFLKVLESRSLGWALLTGGLMGYASLVRPSLVLLMPFAFGAAWLAGHRPRQIWKPFFVAHLSLMGVLAPWGFRNAQVSGTFLPLGSEAPLQLWLGTLETVRFADRHWENPNYYPQELLIRDRTPHYFDRQNEPYPVELVLSRGNSPGPILLHYRSEGEREVGAVPMREVAPSRFRGEIPPQPLGTLVRYHFRLNHPLHDGFVRLPLRPADDFAYRVVDDLLADLNLDGLYDVYRAAELANLALDGEEVLPLRMGSFDMAKDGVFSQEDLDLFLARLVWGGQGKDRLLQKVVPRGRDRVEMHFQDGSTLRMPRAPHPPPNLLRGFIRDGVFGYAGRVLPVLVDRRPPAFSSKEGKIFPCDRPGYQQHLTDRRAKVGGLLPCFVRVGMAPLGWEILRNRAYLTLARENFLREPLQVIGGALLRIPRLWLQVGSTNPLQAYQAAGASLLYPALRLLSYLLLLLAVYGFYAERKRWREHLVLAVAPLYLTLVHLPFHAEGRYTIPGRSFFLIYVALGILAIWEAWKGRRSAWE